MVVYNLYLVLIDEKIRIYDNSINRNVYIGSSENIPDELMNQLVHDVTIAHEKDTNIEYILININ